MIVLSKPHLTGNETAYIQLALQGPTSGNGPFTKKCHDFFSNRYGFKRTLLTTSCTAALEMSGLLMDLQPGDEVIIPSFTFVSTANAFILRGASIVFADSLPDHPNMDVSALESLITPKTRAIVAVHYAGVAVDMDSLMALAKKYNLFVVEDAAQAIDASYKGLPLGSIGHFGCFSFHDTKNIVCGEGGALMVNDDRFIARAEIIWEKGTNRNAFIRGEIDKYGWVDIGSSYLPSEITAAFLFAQLEQIVSIQKKRIEKWAYYLQQLTAFETRYNLSMPLLPDYSQHNAHIFYLICNNDNQRDYLSRVLKGVGVQANFHYPLLHLSNYYLKKNKPAHLPNANRFAEKLIRLPLFAEIAKEQQDFVVNEIQKALDAYSAPKKI